ncbi:VPLPA-CTERM sorting domain-containing protein [Jannaschia seohaensis]|uniref:Putative secreted protein n=1 Tax=Jannaschia seohaensis TaxID=475081 RepID=A0A2Y9AI94_9RHOB|nr:VPLPA-CTERM sorting domain-containing protein [Jannaschia seohaensis]PWJ20197.1 putative secreted protein [Jannaschia seohaensis]SSA44184.1 VPLPA-CTERM protein sorting domain-containing protein [Jannaschia seohaensis]
MMSRIAGAAVLAVSLLPSAAAASVVDFTGAVTAFTAPTGYSGTLTTGDLFGGTLSFDETDPLCPDACLVTSAALTIGSGLSITIPTDPVTISFDTTTAPGLNGTFSFGDVDGLTNLTVSFGLNAGGAGTFVFDADEGIGFASGTFSIAAIPLPASVLLLLAGAGALAALRRRPS